MVYGNIVSQIPVSLEFKIYEYIPAQVHLIEIN